MRVWKLLPPERRKQLILVSLKELLVLVFVVVFGVIIIVEVGVKFYIGTALYGILLLIFVQDYMETTKNFKELITDLEEDLEFKKED